MNETKAEGMFDQAKGKLKQAFGDATGDPQTANSGVADQVKGSAKEAWGNVKETASGQHGRSAGTRDAQTHSPGHDMREEITSGAENLKNSINRGLQNLENKAHE